MCTLVIKGVRYSVRPFVQQCVGPFQARWGSVCHKIMSPFSQRASLCRLLTGRYLDGERVALSV